VPAISVYTPVHNSRWIERAWKSLQSQKFTNFEWVLVPNGDCRTLPDSLLSDPRIRVFAAHDLTGNIGALKKFAVSHATADILVELDHDDELTPDALLAISREADPTKAEFLYSDFAAVEEGYKPFKYSADYNWTTYTFYYQGHQLLASKAFDACPVSLGYLPFAPNHVRAFTRKAYEVCGGYDDKLLVADDYDLMVKMYINQVEFKRIESCLYIYHLHSNNTSTNADRQATIERTHLRISHARNTELVSEWVRRQKLLTFELSVMDIANSPRIIVNPLKTLSLSGEDRRPVFHGLSDMADNSVGELVVSNLLPYLDRTLILPFFQECYRILAPGGWMRCQFPSTDGRAAYTNPLYLSHWNTTTLWTFTRRAYADMAGVSGVRFYEARAWDYYPTAEHETAKMLYAQVDLVALKGQRQPGWAGI